tara:strand:- start:2826 stop:3395 length:570 start_codon:yes stop_codon:yes gene_type:complete
MSTILLQHILFLWFQNNEKAFFKFKTANKQSEGESFCEELGFSRREFDTALSKISTKVDRLNEDVSTFIKHSTDFTRKTWYYVNIPLFEEKLQELYSKDSEMLSIKTIDDEELTPYDMLCNEEEFLNVIKMQIKGTYDIKEELGKYSDHVIYKGESTKSLKQYKSGFRNWIRNHMRMNLSSTGERKMIM